MNVASYLHNKDRTSAQSSESQNLRRIVSREEVRERVSATAYRHDEVHRSVGSFGSSRRSDACHDYNDTLTPIITILL